MTASRPLVRATDTLLSRGLTFTRGLWRIAGADASSGNVVTLLRDGPCAFDAMIEAIDAAVGEVALESYLVQSDSVGERFAGALIAAADRGVRVRFIADWVGSRGCSSHFWREMREHRVEIRIFSPPGWRGWFGLLPRDHRKLLVVDNAVGFTGGFGLAEVWSGMVRKRKRSPWRDTAIRIAGPAAVDMQRAFETMWGRASGQDRRAARRPVRGARGTDIDPDTAAGAVVGIIEGEPWRLRVARAAQMQAVTAERSIWVASAYFYPSDAEIEALAGAALDGVDVRVLVPSKYDHPWVRRLTRSTYARLLANGVRIWEWNGSMMHAKTSVIDDHWVRVGSTDFNPLGVAINYELDAVVEDRALGREAADMYLSDLEQSTEIRPAANPQRVAPAPTTAITGSASNSTPR